MDSQLLNDHMTRTKIWSQQIKDVFQEDLLGMKYVDLITEFTDGEEILIPSVGQLEARDYAEGQSVSYSDLATGQYKFRISDYVQSGIYITKKAMQDSFMASRVTAMFPEKMNRAIAERMEADIMDIANVNQTANDYNVINGGRHRMIGSGTGNTITLEDVANVNHALNKAATPRRNRVAIVDPSIETQLSKLMLQGWGDANPRWDRINAEGISTGMQFITSIQGIDFYTSSFLPTVTSETIDGRTVTNGIVNQFFCADSSALPFVGNVRQSPELDSSYNKDLQRFEHVVTARYGFGLFRPESLVTVITEDRTYE